MTTSVSLKTGRTNMDWHCLEEPDIDGFIHVWPAEDRKEHITWAGELCWCSPYVDYMNMIVNHRRIQ